MYMYMSIDIYTYIHMGIHTIDKQSPVFVGP